MSLTACSLSEDASSFGMSTCNENGLPEVNIEYRQTFWQWLTGGNVTRKAWEYRPDLKHWMCKNTATPASHKDLQVIYNIQLRLDNKLYL